MTLLERLQQDMKTAMKAGDKLRLGVIRMLLNEVKNIDLQPSKPTEQEAVAAYSRKLAKSIDEYRSLNKPDEVARLEAEQRIVREYMPAQWSEVELEKAVDEFLAANAFTEKQFGAAMGAFMKLHGQHVDGAAAAAMLRRKLAARQPS